MLALMVFAGVLVATAPAATGDDLAPAILNGDDASVPGWMAGIFHADGDRFQCGGTLITQDWVLTARHCLFRTPTSNRRVPTDQLRVSVGRDVEGVSTSDLFQVRQVRLDVLPQGVPNNPAAVEEGEAASFQFDYALLQLDAPARGIAPLPLATASMAPEDGRYRVYGWGDTSPGTDEFPETLQVGEVVSVRRKQCGIPFSLRHALVCAQGQITLNGDSGGPLVGLHGGRQVLHGIASFTQDPTELYSGYVLIHRLRSWLARQTGQSCGGEWPTIHATPRATTRGTAGPDVIMGTAGPDVIFGLGGEDIICGLGGNDYLHGGGGPDRLIGGAGNDQLLGGGGDDDLEGGAGRDDLLGQGGADDLNGGGGDDQLSGGKGIDFLNGRGGHDVLIGNGGRDRFVGSRGLDDCRAGVNEPNSGCERPRRCAPPPDSRWSAGVAAACLGAFRLQTTTGGNGVGVAQYAWIRTDGRVWDEDQHPGWAPATDDHGNNSVAGLGESYGVPRSVAGMLCRSVASRTPDDQATVPERCAVTTVSLGDPRSKAPTPMIAATSVAGIDLGYDGWAAEAALRRLLGTPEVTGGFFTGGCLQNERTVRWPGISLTNSRDREQSIELAGAALVDDTFATVHGIRPSWTVEEMETAGATVYEFSDPFYGGGGWLDVPPDPSSGFPSGPVVGWNSDPGPPILRNGYQYWFGC